MDSSQQLERRSPPLPFGLRFGPRARELAYARCHGEDVPPTWSAIIELENQLPAPGSWIVITWRGTLKLRIVEFLMGVGDPWACDLSVAHVRHGDDEHPLPNDGSDTDGFWKFQMPAYPAGAHARVHILFVWRIQDSFVTPELMLGRYTDVVCAILDSRIHQNLLLGSNSSNPVDSNTSKHRLRLRTPASLSLVPSKRRRLNLTSLSSLSC